MDSAPQADQHDHGHVRDMRPVEDVRREILNRIRTLAPIELPLQEAYGCVLAADVAAEIDMPGFSSSAMDGFAVRASDVASATEDARSALQQRDFDTAVAAASRLEGAGGPFRQAAALRLRAGIELARGDNESAAMFAGQSFSIWQTPDAAVVAARANLRAGAPDRARNWLRRALEAGASAAAVRADPELSSLA